MCDGVLGANRLSASLHQAFGKRGLPMVIPVAESAMLDALEHVAFVRGFTPILERQVAGITIQCGPWVSVSNAFGELTVGQG